MAVFEGNVRLYPAQARSIVDRDNWHPQRQLNVAERGTAYAG
jgi:hypothetical protein